MPAPPGRPYGLQAEAKRILRGIGMPEVGGKRLASDLKVGLPDLRKIASSLRDRSTTAVARFQQEAENVGKALKMIEDEADAMRDVANEILGNNPPEDSQPDPPKPNGVGA